MPKVTITNVPGLDGEYNLDFPLLNRDYRTIKELSGARVNEIMEALRAGDITVIVAFVEIALRRAGKPHDVDQLWDADPECFLVVMDEVETDASPPPQDSAPKSSDGSASSGNGSSVGTESFPEKLIPDSSGTPR